MPDPLPPRNIHRNDNAQNHSAHNQHHKHSRDHGAAVLLIRAALSPLGQSIARLAVHMGLFAKDARDGLREGLGLLR